MEVTFLDLERPSELARLSEPELFLESRKDHLVIIDEVQRRPDLFPVLRALVDAHRQPGRFLVLGSASPDLLRQSSESLAGRIDYLELAPLTLPEVTADRDPTEPEDAAATMYRLWLRGGFPDSYLAPDDSDSMRWREAFIRTYLEQDLPQLGVRIGAARLRRFWSMLAHRHGQLWNASTFAGALGLSAPTVRSYLDLLESTFMVRVLQPWSTNAGKRLVKSPKVYIRDSGLLHALQNLPDRTALAGHPVIGASWEGWVIEQILAQVPVGTRTWFYRTASGNELDLLLELPGGALRPVEIKYSKSPSLGRGHSESLGFLGVERGFVIAPVDASYPVSSRVTVLPVADLGRIWAD
jgi:predicted AAA+ superfamily ATPase